MKPTKDEKGVWRVGGRTERWIASTWNRQKFILLPKDAHVSVLIARYLHESGGHLGVAASISKVLDEVDCAKLLPLSEKTQNVTQSNDEHTTS